MSERSEQVRKDAEVSGKPRADEPKAHPQFKATDRNSKASNATSPLPTPERPLSIEEMERAIERGATEDQSGP